MKSVAFSEKPNIVASARRFENNQNILASDSRYDVRIACGPKEIADALRLRHEVFNVELQCGSVDASGDSRMEFDAYDFKCRHLIVADQRSGRTVGTYRLNTFETARSAAGFYSAKEFTIEDLPAEILQDGIELGRACIASEHRNTKVLFLLWKGLLAYAENAGKRYFFGCCSIFTQDETEGVRVYKKLKREGHFDEHLKVNPKQYRIDVSIEVDKSEVKLPALFDMYLRLGARVCSPPMLDGEFGSIDLFVVFDLKRINEKFRRMFSVR